MSLNISVLTLFALKEEAKRSVSSGRGSEVVAHVGDGSGFIYRILRK